MEAITRKLRSRRTSEVGGRKLSSAHASNDSILSSSETDGPFDSKGTADRAKTLPSKDLMVDFMALATAHNVFKYILGIKFHAGYASR